MVDRDMDRGGSTSDRDSEPIFEESRPDTVSLQARQKIHVEVCGILLHHDCRRSRWMMDHEGAPLVMIP